MFQQFVLLKDIDQPTLDSILYQNDLYSKLDSQDIINLPEVNEHNFINICNFVDYYQLDDDTEFIANIQYHILRKTTKVINNMHLIPLNIQQKVYQNQCLTKMKCEDYNIKHIACYKFLDPSGYGINEASGDGHLELIKYLFKTGEDCTTWAIDRASGDGHLEIIKYLFEIQHKDCTTLAINSASELGHLEVVKYLFEVMHKDCTTDAIDDASYGGHLEIVKYLFEVAHQKCTTMAINFAGKNGYLEIVQYLIEVQHKKYTVETFLWARKQDKIVEYLKSHPDSFIK